MVGRFLLLLFVLNLRSTCAQTLTSSGLLFFNAINASAGNITSIAAESITAPIAGAFKPMGWGAHYYEALLASNHTLVKIALIGDSISAGFLASPIIPSPAGYSYANVLQTQLQVMYGDGGAGFLHPCQGTSGNPGGPYSVGSTSGVTISGSWNAARNMITSFTNEILYSTTPGDSAVFYGRGSIVSVYGHQIFGSLQAYNVTITSISGSVVLYAQSYLNPQGTSSATNSMMETVINGLPLNIPYLVRIVNTSPSGTVFYLAGVASYNPTGIVIHNFGVPSTQLHDLFTDTSTDGASVVQVTGGPFFSSLYGDLIILSLDVNDANYGSSTYSADLTSFLSQADSTDQPLLFLQQMVGNPASSYNTPLMQSFRQTHVSLSFLYNYAYIDMNTLVGRNSFTYQLNTLGYYGDGNIHPSSPGHAMIAATMLPYLTLSSSYSAAPEGTLSPAGSSHPSSLLGLLTPATVSPHSGSSSSSTGGAGPLDPSSTLLYAPLASDYSGTVYGKPYANLTLSSSNPSAVGFSFVAGHSAWTSNSDIAGQGILVNSSVVLTHSYTKCLWMYLAGGAGHFYNLISSNDPTNAPNAYPENAGDHIFGLLAGSSPGLLAQHQSVTGNSQNYIYGPFLTSVVGLWTHLCLTYDDPSTTFQFYVNGTASGAPQVNTITPLWTTATPAQIFIGGLGPASNPNEFIGSLAEVRIYNTALSASSISQVYSSNIL